MTIQERVKGEVAKGMEKIHDGLWRLDAPLLEDLLTPGRYRIMTEAAFQRGLERIAQWAEADGCSAPMNWAAAFEEEGQ